MGHDVVAVGELLIDFAPQGTTEDGWPILRAQPGGAPGNYLAALAGYGHSTAFVGKVGHDAFGQLLLDALTRAGIEVRGVVSDPKVFTTLAFVTLDETGERSFSFARKPGADTQLRWEEVDRELLDGARVVHFGTLSLTQEPARTATRRTISHARAAGKLISFDPNLRPSLWDDLDRARAEILWGLDQADVVKIGGEEVDFLWGCGPEEGARRILAEHGAALVMVTLGGTGCYLRNGRAECFLPCPAVVPVDTTGAGDIFGGSAMHVLLRLGAAAGTLGEEELRQVGRFAVTAASLSTQHRGGMTSVPPEGAVWARMAGG